MPFQLDGTSATHAAPFGSVPVKWAVDADADEPVPATSVRDEDDDEERVPKPDAETVHDRPPVLVPASRPLCPRRQMTMGVSNVEAYLSTTLILLPGRADSGCGGGASLAERAEVNAPFSFPVALSGPRGTRSACPRTATPSARDRGRRRPRGRARDSRAPQPPGDKRLRRSHRYFFFVKAGPKSGLTWQFWILPTHIESSWRPWWFVRER